MGQHITLYDLEVPCLPKPILRWCSTLIVEHDLWMRRPLPKNYAAYAATDAEMAHALYELFISRSFVTPDLPSQSMRYITMYKHRRPSYSDSHLWHPLLPLEILDTPASDATTFQTCATCDRSLSEKAYEKDDKFRTLGVSSTCRVCSAVKKRIASRGNGGGRGRGRGRGQRGRGWSKR